MINIAICISGEPRKYFECLNSIKRIRESNPNFNIHVFFHFWNNVTECISQQRRCELLDVPVKETYTTEEITREFAPTRSVCESKDTLIKDATIVYEYLQTLIKKHNPVGTKPSGYHPTWRKAWHDLDEFTYRIKNTNVPPLSQIISFFRCQDLRIKYEQEKNIQYDLIIRTRSDISFNLPTNIEEKLIQRPIRAIEFKELRICTDAVLYGEPAFFIYNTKIVNNTVFEDYSNKIKSLMFRIRIKEGKHLHILTDHSIMPEFFSSQSIPIQAPQPFWKWKLNSSKIKI